LPFLQGNAEFGALNPVAVHRCDAAPKRAAYGDILLSVRAPVGALNVADRAYGIGRGLAAIRARPSTDARYLWWALHSAVEHLRAVAVGSTYPAVTSQDVGRLAIPLHGLERQRAMANYLDRETARLDTLIEKKRSLSELLELRWQANLENEIRRLANIGTQPLKHSAELVVGIVITPSAWYADTGVPAIRGLNVRPGRISTEDMVYLTSEGDAVHIKSRLRAGDVVVVRTGQAGAAAVVPKVLEGANCIDLVIIRPGPQLDSQFLELVLNSDWMQKHIDEHTVGTIQGHFNVSAAKNVPIPLPVLSEQHRAVERLRQVRAQCRAAVSRAEGQIELLQERRQALITAAVTGQISIPAAA
jgi:type I restriction enzyme S subunit